MGSMGASGHYRGKMPFAGLSPAAREMRREETPAEHILWAHLRGRRLGGVKFRRQHQFGPYICDFYCADAELVVECDGPVHGEYRIRKHDWTRERYMKSSGLMVVRVSNEEVLEDVARVVQQIGEAVSRRLAERDKVLAHGFCEGRGA
jgi:very-short-patch-repair endonuclease